MLICAQRATFYNPAGAGALSEASGVEAEEGPDAVEVPGLLARVRRVLQHPLEPHRQDHLLRRSEQCGLEVLKSAY